MHDEIIIDHEIKSDEYKVPINTLVVLNKPTTVSALSKLLDDNGYFGRYKILRKVTKNLGDIIITVEVYLPNSNFTYTWPFKTFYNLTLGRLLRRPALKSYDSVNLYIFMLSIAHGACGHPKIELTTLEELPYQLPRTFGLSKNNLNYIFKTWAQAGLFGLTSNNKLIFRLKHDNKIYSEIDNKDFEEVIYNLFKPEIWPD